MSDLNSHLSRPTSAIVDAVAVVASCSSFMAVAWTSQALQAVFRISTATLIIPSVIGTATAFFASFAAARVADITYANGPRLLITTTAARNCVPPSSNELPPVVSSVSAFVDFLKRADLVSLRLPEQVLGAPAPSSASGTRIVSTPRAVSGHTRFSSESSLQGVFFALCMYAAVGGRPLMFTPSSLVAPGAFSRSDRAIPATLRFANTKQRATVAAAGLRFGCHTCGTRQLMARMSRRRPEWVADHQPPVKLTRAANAELWRTWGRAVTAFFGIPPRWPFVVSQAFYPHCTRCSSVQGGSLAAGKKPAVRHFRPLRIVHIAPALTAVAWVRFKVWPPVAGVG
eukprot:TRINITY_DN21494_c0_g1_i1.p1 TRINITY_DN21494_c0_g1~~TRINITY_DN21494_c0_g1_i1.p1  ORF type:complete len:342 (+),score=22.21 TRINITY_DN21494_c0_g1_i1:69-1094(+)